jgi:Cdc6-like AAA superfamily ATPase
LRILFIGDNSICTDRLDCRSQIISRLPRLTQLDRVVITSRDRRSAELDYLRRYGTEWRQSRIDNNTSNQFDQYHQEFARLITKYGAPDLDIDGRNRDERIRSRLIRLNIVFPLTSIESTTISIPSSMNVGKIKTLIARHCSRCNNSNARSLRLSTGDLGC